MASFSVFCYVYSLCGFKLYLISNLMVGHRVFLNDTLFYKTFIHLTNTYEHSLISMSRINLCL